jgi:hypothetical protein
MKRIRPGMKVVPFQKTAANWNGLNLSNAWRQAQQVGQPYLFVIGFSKHNPKAWILDFEMNDILDGDYFNRSDFEIYVDK